MIDKNLREVYSSCPAAVAYMDQLERDHDSEEEPLVLTPWDICVLELYREHQGVPQSVVEDFQNILCGLGQTGRAWFLDSITDKVDIVPYLESIVVDLPVELPRDVWNDLQSPPLQKLFTPSSASTEAPAYHLLMTTIDYRDRVSNEYASTRVLGKFKTYKAALEESKFYSEEPIPKASVRIISIIGYTNNGADVVLYYTSTQHDQSALRAD